MNQQELNDLYKSLSIKDDDDELDNAIKKSGGCDVVVFYDGGDDLGGTFGLDDLFEMLKKHNFTVLDDPRYDYENTGDQGCCTSCTGNFPAKVRRYG
jgi:hypothetical protein